MREFSLLHATRQVKITYIPVKYYKKLNFHSKKSLRRITVKGFRYLVQGKKRKELFYVFFRPSCLSLEQNN